MSEPACARALADFRWEGVETRAYKDEASAPFKSVTRQVLASGARPRGELRYFEVAPGGYTTLERHAHVHAVMILRGAGRALVGDEVFEVEPLDLVTMPAWTWHQFRAAADAPLGFLCMVDADARPAAIADGRGARRRWRRARVARFLAGA